MCRSERRRRSLRNLFIKFARQMEDCALQGVCYSRNRDPENFCNLVITQPLRTEMQALALPLGELGYRAVETPALFLPEIQLFRCSGNGCSCQFDSVVFVQVSNQSPFTFLQVVAQIMGTPIDPTAMAFDLAAIL